MVLMVVLLLAGVAEAGGLRQGDEVRLRLLDGSLVEGVLLAGETNTWALESAKGMLSFPAEEVDTVWTRGRATGKGLKYGALGGAVALGAYGALLGTVVPFDDDGVNPVVFGLWGALIGGLSGGAAGGLVGAVIPRWERLEDSGPAAVATSPPGSRRLTGGLALGAGYAESQGGTSAGGGLWRMHVFAGKRGGVRHGMEMAWARPGNPRRPAPQPGQPVWDHQTLWQFGWRGELPVTRSEPGRPVLFLSGGLATYRWLDRYLGYSLGGGVRLASSWQGPGLSVELRRHDNIQNLTESDPAHWTGSASLILHW